MNWPTPPSNKQSLEQRLRNLEGEDAAVQRRRTTMSLVVVGQMLPEGAIKGGSAMALRFGRGSRFTRDLDAARIQSLDQFRADFEESLAAGWAGFTGRLVEQAAPRPVGVPTGYVMQPFDVRLDYRHQSWFTAKFELGHNEIGDGEDPEYRLAEDLIGLFTDVGLPAPIPVPVRGLTTGEIAAHFDEVYRAKGGAAQSSSVAPPASACDSRRAASSGLASTGSSAACKRSRSRRSP